MPGIRTMSEAWAIMQRECFGADSKPTILLPPIDDDNTDCIIVWPTREQAEQGLDHQIRMGFIEDGEVVRLFPREE